MAVFAEPLRLKFRVYSLVLHLRGQGITCWIQWHYRKPDCAHRWSTAYNIISGKINVGKLRCLTDGRDLDGNLWFKPEWGPDAHDNVPANQFQAIVVNAKKLGPKTMAYAEEGYAVNDPRRKPNLKDVPISKHVTGCAIDLNVDWTELGGPWSELANALIAGFGLCRPVASESWHVELNKSQRMHVPWRFLIMALWLYVLRRFKKLRCHI